VILVSKTNAGSDFACISEACIQEQSLSTIPSTSQASVKEQSLDNTPPSLTTTETPSLLFILLVNFIGMVIVIGGIVIVGRILIDIQKIHWDGVHIYLIFVCVCAVGTIGK